MNEIIFKELTIEHICKPKLKNSYISVDRELKITLKTPRTSKYFIEKLLLDRENWIRKQLHKLSVNIPKKINIEDEVLYFGEVYSVDMQEVIYLRQKLQRLRKNSKENILRCYDDFYKHSASEYISPRVEYFAQKMDLKFNTLKFRKMRSRWGSCSATRTITFNCELMKVKKELIDYVIVHELAHLVYMNHSKDFHSLVDSYLPSSRSLRKELGAVSFASL